MDDIQARFRRLDRLDAPDLWNEAVGRAAELQAAPRRMFNPGMAMIAVALLLAALAGTIAVGAFLNRQITQPLDMTYDNGWLTTQDECGAIVGLDPASFEPQTLVAGVTNCDMYGGFSSGAVAWTPDGRRMAYLTMGEAAAGAVGDTRVTEVWLYDADSDETRLVGTCPYCGGIDISSDGSLVAAAGPAGLTALEADGGAVHTLDLLGIVSPPQFSPDSRSLAFTVSGGKTGVHVVDVADVMEGTISRPTLVHGIVAAYNATWSPDGEWIAFTRETALEANAHEDGSAWSFDLPTTSTLWVVRRDGSGGRQLTTGDDGGIYAAPTWSPDSRSIAFATGGGGSEGNGLWTVGLDDLAPTEIYRSDIVLDTSIVCPAWSPDGEWIAFGLEAQKAGEAGLLVIRPDGTDAHYVADQPLIPIWQPLPSVTD